LGTENALTRYKENRVDYAKRVNQMVELQLHGLEALMRAGHDIRDCLRNPDNGFDALFIYITASKRNYADIMLEYFTPACVQYHTSVYYDEIYKDLIPSEVREAGGANG
jgi:hypothetical protein